MTDDVLVVDSLVRRFGDLTAVDEVSFRIAPGETYGLLGPNGAGKTTTISMVAGLTAAAAGTVTVTLTAVDPAGTVSFGVSLGTWNGAACQTVIANDAALLNTNVTGSVTAPTSLCARVYDAGRLTAPLNYTITVVHP